MGSGITPNPNTLFIWLCLFQTIWDEHDNRTRLAERIDTVNRWKEMLDKCLMDLDAEIDALTQAGSQGRVPGDPAARIPPPSPLQAWGTLDGGIWWHVHLSHSRAPLLKWG